MRLPVRQGREVLRFSLGGCRAETDDASVAAYREPCHPQEPEEGRLAKVPGGEVVLGKLWEVEIEDVSDDELLRFAEGDEEKAKTYRDSVLAIRNREWWMSRAGHGKALFQLDEREEGTEEQSCRERTVPQGAGHPERSALAPRRTLPEARHRLRTRISESAKRDGCISISAILPG